MSEETVEQKQPTRQEIIDFLNESIEISKLRAELQSYNTQIATERAEELKALVFIAQVTNPKPEEQEKHIVTDEDIAANPQLVEAGLKAGDEVMIPKQERKLKRETAK
jgi:hypothetical protein